MSFQAAVDSGVSSAMESYNTLNSIPVASSRRYLIDVLRGRLGFLGMLVTDYAEIVNLEHHHRVSAGPEDSVFMAMEDTSIDMSMVPLDASFAGTLLGLVRAGKVSKNRIERSVRRVLALKVHVVRSGGGESRIVSCHPFLRLLAVLRSVKLCVDRRHTFLYFVLYYFCRTVIVDDEGCG